jgi:hypothetical protein
MAFDDSDDEPAIVTGALRWLQLNVRIVHQAHFRSGRWTSLIVATFPVIVTSDVSAGRSIVPTATR